MLLPRMGRTSFCFQNWIYRCLFWAFCSMNASLHGFQTEIPMQIKKIMHLTESSLRKKSLSYQWKISSGLRNKTREIPMWHMQKITLIPVCGLGTIAGSPFALSKRFFSALSSTSYFMSSVGPFGCRTISRSWESDSLVRDILESALEK